ncbi:MAG: CBS domain-containing protein [Gemmataceae bacterium]|nr:CBS domain-containing protein [Gemmataceae bacterium]
MNLVNKPLLSLAAGDLMSPATVLVPADMSLEGAARLLAQAQVSGAPVVDADGRCVGVLSATDFVRWAQRGKSQPFPPPSPPELVYAWTILEDVEYPGEVVRQYITGDTISVPPTATVGEVARLMLDARIHRVIVVDEDRRPIGVVSTTDILAAVAQTDAIWRMAIGATSTAPNPGRWPPTNPRKEEDHDAHTNR